MSPADRAGPVSAISPYLLDVFIWSRGRAGSVPEISVQSNRDLGKWAGNFALWTLHPGYRGERRNEF